MTGRGQVWNDSYCEAKFGSILAKMNETKHLPKGDPNKLISCNYIKTHARPGGILPTLPTSKERDPKGKQTQMCPSYHFLKQCNNTCGRAYDHVAYSHDSPQYCTLDKWGTKCMVTEGAMKALLDANGGKLPASFVE